MGFSSRGKQKKTKGKGEKKFFEKETPQVCLLIFIPTATHTNGVLWNWFLSCGSAVAIISKMNGAA